jgi:arylesterase / paraoxonase
MLRILGWLLLIIVIAGAIIVFRILNAAGYFNEVKPHFAGKCQTVEGVVGAEDIELDRADGVLFLSSQDRRPAADGTYKAGTIFLALIDRPDMQPSPLIENDASFHPHGLSLFADAAGRKTLAVVNHTGAGDEVRLFDVTDTPDDAVKLTLRRTVTHPLMRSLNDVTLVSHEAFYVTNDHGSETDLGRFLETWLLLPRANAVYYDGTEARIAATGFNYANGINRNADASEIYIAEATGRALQTFRRDMTTGALSHIHTLALAVGPDNLDVDAEGAIWIGAHPRLLDFLAHADDPKKLSPSAVLKVTPAGDETKVEEIYVNMGEELSGSSVAIHHANRLIIGPVFDPKFLNCTLN